MPSFLTILQATPIKKIVRKQLPRTPLFPDSSLKISDELELVLPSGSKVGHRSLKYTFKQRLPTFEQRKNEFNWDA